MEAFFEILSLARDMGPHRGDPHGVKSRKSFFKFFHCFQFSGLIRHVFSVENDFTLMGTQFYSVLRSCKVYRSHQAYKKPLNIHVE